MIASVHRCAYQLKSVETRCRLERCSRVTPLASGSRRYSPRSTSKYGPPTRTCSSSVVAGIWSVRAAMVNARRCCGSHWSMVSVNSTPPVNDALRTPPTPSCDNVASTGSGKPILRVHESGSSLPLIAQCCSRSPLAELVCQSRSPPGAAPSRRRLASPSLP